MKKIFTLIICCAFAFSGYTQCDPGYVPVTVAIDTDDYGYELYWELTPEGNSCGQVTLLSFGNSIVGCDGGGAQIATSNDPGAYGSNTTIYENLCAPTGDCYSIHYVDDYGDGGASFTLILNGVAYQPVVGTGSGNIWNFCAVDEEVNIEGCTDNQACNFNPNANVEDGSCISPGDPCNDGNASTINDVYTANCVCSGSVDPCSSSTEVYLIEVGFYVSGTDGFFQGPPTLNYNPSNPKNYINPGENVRFKVKCYNNKSDGNNLVSAQCSIQTDSPGVTLTDGTAGLNNVAWGNSAWSTDEFEIAIASSVQPGTMLSFDFIVTDNFSNSQYITKCIDFVVAPLWYDNAFIDDDSNPDSQGNDNNIVEPNEIIEFYPVLENVSAVPASSVKGLFYDPNECSDITIWNNISGISGNVVNNSFWNYSQNAPQTIDPGEDGMVPQFDFVFNYNKPSIYSFDLNLDMKGSFYIFPNQISLVKWYIPYTFNQGSPPAPDCNSVGINNLSEIDSYSLYPNPTKGVLNIDLLEYSQLQIINLTGELVMYSQLNSGHNTIDVSNLSSGVYFIKMQNEQGIVSQEKFIKD